MLGQKWDKIADVTKESEKQNTGFYYGEKSVSWCGKHQGVHEIKCATYTQWNVTQL